MWENCLPIKIRCFCTMNPLATKSMLSLKIVHSVYIGCKMGCKWDCFAAHWGRIRMGCVPKHGVFFTPLGWCSPGSPALAVGRTWPCLAARWTELKRIWTQHKEIRIEGNNNNKQQLCYGGNLAVVTSGRYGHNRVLPLDGDTWNLSVHDIKQRQ